MDKIYQMLDCYLTLKRRSLDLLFLTVNLTKINTYNLSDELSNTLVS